MTMREYVIPESDRWRWWAYPVSLEAKQWCDVVAVLRVDFQTVYFVRTLIDRRIAADTHEWGYLTEAAARHAAARAGHSCRTGLMRDKDFDRVYVPVWFGVPSDVDVQLEAYDLDADADRVIDEPRFDLDTHALEQRPELSDAELDAVRAAFFAAADRTLTTDARDFLRSAFGRQAHDDLMTIELSADSSEIKQQRREAYARDTSIRVQSIIDGAVLNNRDAWWACVADSVPDRTSISVAATRDGRVVYLVMDAKRARLAHGAHREGYTTLEGARSIALSLRTDTTQTMIPARTMRARLPSWYTPVVAEARADDVPFSDWTPARRRKTRQASSMIVAPSVALRWWEQSQDASHTGFVRIRVGRRLDDVRVFLVQSVDAHRVASGTRMTGYETEAEARAAAERALHVVLDGVFPLLDVLPDTYGDAS